MPDEDADGQKRQPQRVVREFQQRKRTLPRWEAANTTYSVRHSVLEHRPERLTTPGIAEIVRGALHFQDGRRCKLHFYTIMPTHIHVVLEPLPRNGGSIALPEIIHSVKSYSGQKVNALVGGRGPLWLGEGYNRMIRCYDEYIDWYSYILLNAPRAGLVDDPRDRPYWWERDWEE